MNIAGLYVQEKDIVAPDPNEMAMVVDEGCVLPDGERH